MQKQRYMRRRDNRPSLENLSVRLPGDVSIDIADMMDLRTLSIWRTTCQFHLYDSSISLADTLDTTLRKFFQSPDVALAILEESDAVVCGEAALEIVLRGTIPSTDVLDIVVTEEHYDMLISQLAQYDGVHENIVRVIEVDISQTTGANRHITAVSRCELYGGREIYVHSTDTKSAVSPLAKMPCTAMMNFVNSTTIGCAYPDLTLACKNLTCDVITQAEIFPHEVAALDRIKARGIETVLPPELCADRTRARMTEDRVEFTGKDKAYLCPLTARFFGDKYSLMISINPDRVDKSIIPYGAMVVFRLPIRTRCDGEHEIDVEVLPPSVTLIETAIGGEMGRRHIDLYESDVFNCFGIVRSMSHEL